MLHAARTAEQLETSIKPEQDCAPLWVQQLLLALKRLQTDAQWKHESVPTFYRCVAAITSFMKQSQFKLLCCSVVSKIWVHQLCKSLHLFVIYTKFIGVILFFFILLYN